MKALLVACVVVVASPALADKTAAKPAPSATPGLGQLIPPDGDPSGATFAFAGNGVYTSATAQQMTKDFPAGHVVKNVAGAFSKNKKSYWASGDVASSKSQTVDGHASAVWDKTDTGWKLVAFSIVPTATDKQQQDAKKKGAVAPAIKALNGAGDEYFLTVFDKVFSENAAETVGARKDAVLFGSAANERYVGGASIKKTLAGWDLTFTVHGDMADGKTSGRLLWIAANIDARPQTKPKADPTPYRVFLVYEGDSDGNYELVHASFAAVTSGWPQ